MQIAIRHTTHYRFDRPLVYGIQQLRLRPQSDAGQSVIDWHITLTGAQIEAEYEDQNRNSTTLASALPGTTEIAITCEGVVDTRDRGGIVGPHSGFMPLWIYRNQAPLTAPGPKMRALAASLKVETSDNLDLLHRLSARILAEVAYEIGHTTASTPAEQALAAGHGVCQDHAHVFIGCARSLGIPARYVSGYLMMNDRIDQEAGHGWAEAYVEGLGWVGFDISNGICPDERYVRIATGRDYRDAAPVNGVSYGAGESLLAVSLAVEQKLCQQ
jgi:transglutaminase-like putative cysteine protease